MHRILVLVFIAGLVAGCGGVQKAGTFGRQTTDTLNASALHAVGRYDITPEGLELISSAVHFGFSFQGTECQVVASIPARMDHNYLQYEIDGVYGKRIRVSKGAPQVIRLSASGNGKHTVWIFKATEAQTGPIFVQRVIAPSAVSIMPSTAPLIEFIGNSITCGAAADTSEIPCRQGEYHDHHNAYMAYGPRVARALGTSYIVTSVSGIGVYRNWNSDGPAMPAVYEHTDLQAGSSRMWDFERYHPAVVSIALGTNDLSTGDGKKPRAAFDSGEFVRSYVHFVQLVKSKYPQARIALLSSPMMSGERRVLLQNCLNSVATEIDALNPSEKPVALFFFSPMKPGGCAGHPSVEDHAVMARALRPFFLNLLR